MTRENAVAEPRDSDAFVRQTLDALTAHVAVLDAEGRILAVNASWRAFARDNAGSPERTAEGADYLAVCDAAASAGDDAAAAFAAGIRSVAAGGDGPFALEYPCHSPQEQRWFVGRVTRFTRGDHAYLVVAHEDVTARRLAEERLERQERHFRGLIENSADVITVLDESLNTTYVSPSVGRVLGWVPDEVVGMPVLERVHPDDLPRVTEMIGALWEVPGATPPIEIRYRHRDGSWRRFELVANNMLHDPAVRGVVVNSRDVTERREAEEAFHRTEALYRSLVEELPALTYVDSVGEGGAPAYVSPQIHDLLGYEAGDWLESLEFWRRHLHPEDAPWVLEQWDRCQGTGEPFEAEYRMIRADGRVVWIHERSAFTRGEDGAPRLVQGVLLDVSERKHAEELLLRSQELLADSQRMAHVGSYEMDLVAERTSWSAELFRIYGLDPETTVPSLELALSLTHPDDDAVVREIVERAFREGGDLEFDHRIVRPDGEERVLRRKARVETDAVGRAVRWKGTAQDITDQVKVEGELRTAEERYRRLAEQIPAVTYIWETDPDPRNPCYWVSPRIEWMLGFTPDEWNSDEGFWLSRLHPDDREMVLAATERSMESGEPFRVECRYLHRDGHVVWARDEAELLSRREDGAPDLFQGVMFDISERVRAEQALRESLQRFQNLARQAPVGIFQSDARGDIFYANDRWCEISGLSPEQAAVGGWIGALHPDDRARVSAEWYEHVGRVGEFRTEARFLRPDGEVRWIAGNATPLFDEHGRLTGYLGTVIDLTERVTAEERLRLLESAVENTGESIVIVARPWTSGAPEVVYANPAFSALTGYAQSEIVGRPISIVRSSRSDREVFRRLSAELDAGRSFHGEMWSVRRDGTEFLGELHVSPIFDADGTATHAVTIARDVTAARAAERDLQESVELLRRADGERRALLQRLVEAEEQERGRLAEGIHDDSIQQMAAVAIRLEALKRSLSDPNQLGALDRLGESVERAVDRLRTLLVELRPRSLDMDGLGAALRQYLEQAAEDGGFEFTIESELREEPAKEPRAAAYRIAQDAIANAVQHARASRVDVRVGEREGGFVLRVTDDGEGFDPATLEGPGAGVGIAAMRERAELIGGTLDVRSTPGGGTTVELWLPA